MGGTGLGWDQMLFNKTENNLCIWCVINLWPPGHNGGKLLKPVKKVVSSLRGGPNCPT